VIPNMKKRKTGRLWNHVVGELTYKPKRQKGGVLPQACVQSVGGGNVGSDHQVGRGSNTVVVKSVVWTPMG